MGKLYRDADGLHWLHLGENVAFCLANACLIRKRLLCAPNPKRKSQNRRMKDEHAMREIYPLLSRGSGYILIRGLVSRGARGERRRKKAMAARVVCFGADDCNRSLVLRNVGYQVDRCPSLIEFRTLIRERADADAVLVTERPTADRRQVVTLTREHSRARLVLFDNSYDDTDEGAYDLIVPPLTPPREWLREIADLIERSQNSFAASTAIREQSARARQTQNRYRMEEV
jgi:hypothetical protein